ncbi:putative YigZ family protein [Georgenia soli]|uniref:Putative YigZ family protein n=1 Tax=Georgenia soli TaxID=638953 RepID=A0A2A9EJY5_9MICO|nr:YigZ family protein [Georgenia soli]PFG38550.1 putative YigZ family protein [Georgenia soli]
MSDLRPARGADVRTETEIRRSRFIALVRRADGEDEARALVTEARATFPDARHHCSAFIVDVDGANRVERSSDDGEPAGTAGMPMLEVLRGSGLTNVVAVVVRYFGGIKLGTGGLVRAYSEAVQGALAVTPRVRAEALGLWTVDVGHADAGRLEAELHARGVGITDVGYSAAGVRFTLAAADGDQLAGTLAALTSGAATPVAAGTAVVEHPVP